MTYDQLTKKEGLLFSRLTTCSTVNSFIIAFRDYVNFLNNDGSHLIIKIKSEFEDFNKEYLLIEKEEVELFNKIEALIGFLESRGKELGVNDIGHDIFDIRSLLKNNSTSSFYEGTFFMDLRDIFRKFISAGYKNEICDLYTEDKFGTQNSILESEFNLLKNKKYLIDKKFERTRSCSLKNLYDVYNYFDELESIDPMVKINTFENTIKQLDERIQENALTQIGKLNISTLSKIVDTNSLLESLETIHSYIEQNHLEDISDKVNSHKVFYLKDGKICHYKKGELQLLSGKEPEYITMFKKVLEHLPDNTHMKIKDFEEKVKGKKFGKRYRLGIGKSSKNFANLLDKNGITNINPVNKRPVVEATEIYITLNNSLN